MSVVITAYERDRFLPEAISSVLAQTMGDLELIVSDNGSKNDLRRVVDAFADPRLRFRRNATNLSLSGNLRNAVAECRGQLIGLLTDDDAWEPNLLETLVPPLLASPELALAFADHWVMNEAGVVQPDRTEQATAAYRRDQLAPGITCPFVRQALLWKCIPALQSALFRRDAVPWGDIPAEVGAYADHWLVYMASRTGRGAWYSPARLARYRVHGDSETARLTTKRRAQSDAWAVHLFETALADEAVREVHPEVRRILLRRVLGRGWRLLRAGNPGQALRTSATSLARWIRPTQPARG